MMPLISCAAEAERCASARTSDATTANPLPCSPARAGVAVAQSVASIEKVNQTISEVDVSSREQSTGIGQVGEAVAQMDSVTQQNAALVEQTAAATKHLDDQVQGLKKAINRFHIGGRSQPAFLSPSPA